MARVVAQVAFFFFFYKWHFKQGSLRPEPNFLATKVKDLTRKVKPVLSSCQDLKIRDIEILKIHLRNIIKGSKNTVPTN